MGNALVGRLMATLLERKVPMWLNASIVELTMESGRVAGAIVRRKSGTQHISCRRAVVLANGSFSGSPAMRQKYFAHVKAGKPHHSHVPDSSDGSGIALAVACGGVIDERVQQPGAWTPVSMVPMPDGSTAAFSHFGDRAKPGVIVVNQAGRRFANEALNYHDFLQAMFAECANDQAIEAFVITSHRHLRKYGLGRVPAFPGRIGPFLRSGYLKRGRAVAELAGCIGVDARALEQTIIEFNRHATVGVDPVFHKGETAYEQAAGEPDVTPNPCVAPLDDGPFYAIKMIPGDIGTQLGLRVDPRSRALTESGAPVPGLFAVGTVASSMMCGTYPGAGAMLGPALTFGYLAAQEIAAGAAPAAAIPPPAARAASTA
jgi:succinate dehydrogenase/fumarate reductase flavoprotein subunit